MNKKINVYWMHCKSCELLIENKLSEIPEVKVNKISEKENFVLVDYKNESDLEKINQSILELWYNTESKKIIKNNPLEYIIIALIFISFWFLFFLLKDIKLFENVLQTDNLSFLVILLIWVVASLSSCLAVTWWIVLGFSKYIDTSKDTTSLLKTQLNFHIGRILWFALWGWILWLIGSYLWSFWILNKALLLIAWIFMIYMWLNILNILPSITKLWITMPKSIWNKILNIKNPAFAPIIWALTFFLPCWFTQGMQVYAASSWSFLTWAMTMGIFALWTAPVLFLVWFWSSYFKNKDFNLMNKIIWVIVIYFWIFILSGFANMFNFNTWATSSQINQNTSDLQEFKEVTMTHNWWWFDNDIILEWAKSYSVTINPTSDGRGCMYWITFPWLDNSEYLVKKWIPIIIDIKDPVPWTYKAVCTAMWMKHWDIIIK